MDATSYQDIKSSLRQLNMKVDISSIPNEARKLTALGNKTLTALQALYGDAQGHLFHEQPSFDISPLADALSTKWSDEEASAVINAFADSPLLATKPNQNVTCTSPAASVRPTSAPTPMA